MDPAFSATHDGLDTKGPPRIPLPAPGRYGGQAVRNLGGGAWLRTRSCSALTTLSQLVGRSTRKLQRLCGLMATVGAPAL